MEDEKFIKDTSTQVGELVEQMKRIATALERIERKANVLERIERKLK